ncbi:MAG TPA: CBS domain-containing protein [Nocardioides sp.]|uniref:CBS domain-containing protein n=1 Tax=Nocardioides sp. TaxID=35761 RepID=UPI002E313E6E|nr:CBS domain-containing protein [Nocardioides sp.]HEX5086434.1 CBS domain-containing protein [Nocardioides sp.]
MLARELMTPDPVTVTESTPVKTALGLLAEHRITSLPVVGRDGALHGVVSEADLIKDIVAPDRRAHEVPVHEWLDRPMLVAQVMSPHAITVHPEDDLADVVELLTSTTIKSVPVVGGDGRVVGMLSRSDVVRVLARADDDLASDVDELLTSVGLGEWLAEVRDGVVSLTGPDGSADGETAVLVARTVPGVVEVVRT